MAISGDPIHLVSVFHYRWAVPVMAQFQRLTPHARGARLVVLRERLGIASDSLRRTVDHLTNDHCWLMPNPGYGHPLRPEYILTKAGVPWAAWCHEIVYLVERIGAPDCAYRKWSMPLLALIGTSKRESARFNELRAGLPAITPRALTIALRELAEAHLIERAILEDCFPPATLYKPNLRRPLVRQLIESLQNAPV